MNKKKLSVIVSSVLVVVVVGLLVNNFVDWPVDTDEVSGDISKASRFSREMESEKLTNMEELLKNDSTFKDGIVAAQVVMQTRAAQFGTLVGMSNAVASNIPVFADVLKEMNATSEMVSNVEKSLAESAENLNDALNGKECSDLAQSTINASLAYTTLQKQNKLATRFIETTDEYLKKAKGDDNLKLVRDQWLEYQKMTAALEGDKESAEVLAKKGMLLTGEKALAAVQNFDLGVRINVLQSCELALNLNMPSQIASTVTPQAFENVLSYIRNAAGVVVKSVNDGNTLNNEQSERVFSLALGEALKHASKEAIACVDKFGLEQSKNINSVDKNVLGLTKDGSRAEFNHAINRLNCGAAVLGVYQALKPNINSSMSEAQRANMENSLNGRYIQSIGNVIKEASVGHKANLEMSFRGL